MDAHEFGLRKLAEAQTKDHVVDALWDLRDSAYDHPELWTTVTAESIFQYLADELENESADGGSVVPADLLARAVERARARA